jgi:hypothetical protein
MKLFAAEETYISDQSTNGFNDPSQPIQEVVLWGPWL